MHVTRLPLRIAQDPRRVILMFLVIPRESRVQRVVNSICEMSDEHVDRLLGEIHEKFSHRHQHFVDIVHEHFCRIIRHNPHIQRMSTKRQLLVGCYFSKEYSNQAVALFNPSIVPHPDQKGLPDGAVRFIMSLRATGEGHLSSIEFRSGVVDARGEVTLDQPLHYSQMPEIVEEKVYTREFARMLAPFVPDLDREALEKLPESFTLREAFRALKISKNNTPAERRPIHSLLDLLEANYDFRFPRSNDISTQVIFPYSKRELVGMEDVRFVRFLQDDGSYIYYGTYTAYDGRQIHTQLIETTDFQRFSIRTMHGIAVKDKGMALFPRKINGQYVITSRQDGENLYIMFSDNLYIWEEMQLLRTPEYDWELIQLGNGGSPIETEAGWLLLTHAVGPMRRYVLSACLLDLEDPSKVIACLDKPLMEPTEEEREGYVPNVLYTCGWMQHGDEIIMPYAMSDSYTGFARFKIQELLDEMIAV
ncbi:Predicted glycosyl hydrolase, GH43/DUF377 family [Catalinimonas alkaloidigena]|uniref:Predicted glycosyl hydrolase, GH43/DUF377 family n=1 Tax=Catalinimonas alkaloidigena TaxID=1075417 RepID=A0A1G9E8W5_9BACT|nr:glycoside hydrolase family 130 protein [Catalinimonas alkaloidigena]SDK72561.1 Predicted glycosyl hydrolase, GH43/DUF377 family [Catalinimonas alkaloidigena]